MENLLDKTTQLWVKATGKRIDPEEYSWLVGPVGGKHFIGDEFISRLISEDHLIQSQDLPNYGLLESIDDLDFSKNERSKLNEKVIDFYENTSNYDIDFWSEWCGFFRPFGHLLFRLFSRRLQQLNLPLSSMDASKGLTSSIIKLKKGNQTKWTIWYRTLKATNNVIYSGIYTTCKPKEAEKNLLKVIFPLPNGNASVIMRKEVCEDGSLLLSSDGKKFGDNGFYFTLTNHRGKYWAKHVKAMHEWIKVYEDKEGFLRANHILHFYGMRFLTLHYRMKKKSKT